MNIEVILPSLLNSLVGGRVWETETPDGDFARSADGTILPFILWGQHGGQDAEYVEQEMGDKTNARIQISVFAPSGITASNLIRDVRDRLLASGYTVSVYGSPIGAYDSARKLRARVQQFSIWYAE